MKTTEDIRKDAVEQGASEEQAVKLGMDAESKEFVEKGSEIYVKT